MADTRYPRLHEAYEEMATLAREHGLGDSVDGVLEASFDDVLDEIGHKLAMLELPDALLDGRERPLPSMLKERILRTRERLQAAIQLKLLRRQAMNPIWN